MRSTPIRGTYMHKKKVTGLKPGDIGGQEIGSPFPSNMKLACNSVQHEQCCSNEATIHLAGEFVYLQLLLITMDLGVL
jgi:hypothetical protein